MRDGDEKDVTISLTHGRGLLGIRALWASIIGPNRLAMSQRKAVTLKLNEAVLIAANIATADSIMFVGVALPQNSPVNPLQAIFSRDDQLGRNTGLPVRLVDQVNQSWSFMQVLLPGEQLFAQITDNAVQSQNVVVATAVF
jgi:hypothetical protein